METSAIAHNLTKRFVSGMRLEDGISVASELKRRGFLSSLDYLGENVTTIEEAQRSAQSFEHALARIKQQGLNATVSVKVTSLGLDLSEDACLELADSVCRTARENGSAVEFDMEDSSYTDRNLRIVREMHSRHQAVRAVIQAYLYRSEADVQQLNALRIPIRLCKGAYREPASVAWQTKAEVDGNYAKLLKTVFAHGSYPAIATHDEEMINRAVTLASTHNVRPDQFEFQMLYGVRGKLQNRVLGQGFSVRLYVPYGEAWYPYFMRRLAERPANVMFVARSLISR